MRRRRDAPDRVADIVGYQQRALLVDADAYRAALGFALVVEETGQDVPRFAGWPAIFEGYENHLVARPRFSIPRAVLADEGAAGHVRWKQIAGVEGEPERGSVRAQRIIRHDRFRHQVGPLRLDPSIDVLPIIAVRPAVEAAVLHRGQVVGHQIVAEFVALVDDDPE